MSETEGPYGLDDVSVVMGTYNERAAIESVLAEIAATDDKAEVVVDSSTDGTAYLAREHGATVVEQPPQGYGVAVREALALPARKIFGGCGRRTQRAPPAPAIRSHGRRPPRPLSPRFRAASNSR